MPAEIIVALDVADEAQCLSLVRQLDPAYCALKIGSELFTHCGPDIVRRVQAMGFRVFLDLKFHDIPNTVMKAVQAAKSLGVWMLTLHAAGGAEMLAAARRVCQSGGPLLIAVTVLTSHTEASLHAIGISGSLLSHSQALADLAKEAGMDGIVCAGSEVARIKAQCGRTFLAVTPGIRLPGGATHDQQRVMSPLEAARAGSDYLVIGRALTEAASPQQRLLEIYQELHGGE